MDLPIENGDFPLQTVSLPEGTPEIPCLMVQSLAKPSRAASSFASIRFPNSAGQALIADAFLAGEGEESLETIAATRAWPLLGQGQGVMYEKT